MIYEFVHDIYIYILDWKYTMKLLKLKGYSKLSTQKLDLKQKTSTKE